MIELLFDLLNKRSAWIIRLECGELKIYTGLKEFRLSDKKDAILGGDVTIRGVTYFKVSTIGNEITIYLGQGIKIVSV